MSKVLAALEAMSATARDRESVDGLNIATQHQVPMWRSHAEGLEELRAALPSTAALGQAARALEDNAVRADEVDLCSTAESFRDSARELRTLLALLHRI